MSPASTGRSAKGPAAQARQHLLDLLQPVIAEAGYDLDDVSVTAAGRRSLVRVTVDADGGIDLDAVATVSRAISAALDATADDADGAFAGPYVLEVSSPGIDRPLTEQRHWRRARGRLVSVDIDDETVTGRVLDTSDHGVTLEVGATLREFAWERLGSGRVQVEFNPPGGPRRTEED